MVRNNVPDALRILGECPAEMRGWEWRHLQRLCRSERHALTAHDGAVHDLAFSPDSKRLASASTDGSVRLWDVASGKELLCFRGHTQAPRSPSFSPDGKRVASASVTQLRFFNSGDVALMECQLAATGEPVAVICAASRLTTSANSTVH